MQKQPLRILVLSHEFPPLGGGAGRVVRHLCDELRARGHSITVWTGKPADACQKDFSYQVRYFSTGRTKQFQTNIPAILNFLVQIVFKGLTSRLRYDLIVSNIAIPAGVAGSIFHTLYGIPHMVWHHGADIHADRPQGAGLFWRFVLRCVWKRASLNCFVSESLASLAQRYGIRGPVGILPVIPDVKVIAQVSRPPAEKLFLFAGRLEPVKNPLLLIEAAALLAQSKECPDVLFRMVGSGRLFEAAQKKITSYGLSNFLLSMSVPVSEMAALYEQAYVLVLPSRAEGFPLTILEAAAFGVPAIGSETIGIRDAIQTEQTGLLFKNEDAQSLAKTIVRLAQDRALRDTLGKNANLFAQKFTAENCADRFTALCDEYLHFKPGNRRESSAR